jgi:GT2 family glycosyltransferase
MRANEAECTLSVIVVAWNVADLTEACVRSVLREGTGLDLEIIVVDNGSGDGVSARIRGIHPKVRVIRNEQNIGFPAANNQALRSVRGQYVLFLNPDTEVRANTLQRCVERLELDPSIGVVGCRLELGDGSTQLEGARREYRLRHVIAEVLYLHMLFPNNRWAGDHRMSWWDHRGAREVEAVSGAFLMTRKNLADQIGGLPQDLFMYHEDLAYCLRARRAGWRVWYQGDVDTLHHWKQSSRRSPLALDLLVSECRVLLVRESQGRVAAFAARLVWGVGSALRMLVAFAGVLAPAEFKARFPRVFDARRHSLQTVWAFLPGLFRQQIPHGPQNNSQLTTQAVV